MIYKIFSWTQRGRAVGLLPVHQLRLYRIILTSMYKWVHFRSFLRDSFYDAFVFKRNMHSYMPNTRNDLDLYIILYLFILFIIFYCYVTNLL